MATCIELCIEDDGTFTVESKEKEETPEMEQAEGGEKTPFKSLDEALAAIQQMAQEASMSPAPEEMAGAEAGPDAMAPADDSGAEEAAMTQSFRGR